MSDTAEILKAHAPQFLGLHKSFIGPRNPVRLLLDAHAQALVKLAEVEKAKNAAYSERNQCVAALARTLLTLGFNVGRAIHPIEDTEWESDWRNILYIDLPMGQVSWHFHDSEAHLIERFPEYDEPWDGHSANDKYKRLKPFPIEFWEMANVDDFSKPIKGTALSKAATLQEKLEKAKEALREIRDLSGSANPSSFNQIKDAVVGCAECSDAALAELEGV